MRIRNSVTILLFLYKSINPVFYDHLSPPNLRGTSWIKTTHCLCEQIHYLKHKIYIHSQKYKLYKIQGTKSIKVLNQSKDCLWNIDLRPRYCQRYINLLNAEHIYTCTFLVKNNFETFLLIYRFEWSQYWINAFILVELAKIYE